jgi:hypothetical protein
MHFQVREKNSSIPGSELNMDAIAKWNDRGPRDVSSLDFGKTGIKKGKKQKNKKTNPSELTKKAVINLTSMLSLFKYE